MASLSSPSTPTSTPTSQSSPLPQQPTSTPPAPPQPSQGQPPPPGNAQTTTNNNNNNNSNSSAGTTRLLQKNPPLPEPKSQQQYVQFRKKGVVVLTQLLTNDESEWKVIEDKLIHREKIEKTKHLKHLIRRSDIPHQLRGLFWLNVSGADQLLYKNQSTYWHYVDKMREAISTREAKIKKIREQRAKEKREKKKMLQELLATVKEDPTCVVQSPSTGGSEAGGGSDGGSGANTEASSTTGDGDRSSTGKEEIWEDDEVEDEATEKADKEAETGWMTEEEKQMMAIEKQIEKDLLRTGMDNEWIRSETGVTKLRRLLFVYSRQNRHIGYCQAMHMLAAHFLLQMEEEKAFWMLTNTIESILPKDYYTEAMTGIRIEIGTFNEILRRFNPRILQHLTSMGILLDVFLTHWFLSLFINVLPDPTIIRVFDLFFFEGSNIIFRVVLGLLKIHEKEILGCTDPGKMMIILRDMPSNISYGELSDAMFSFKIIEKSKIESIKAMYTVQFAKENNIKLNVPTQQKKQQQQQHHQQQQQSPLKAKLWPKRLSSSSSPIPEDNSTDTKKKFQFKQTHQPPQSAPPPPPTQTTQHQQTTQQVQSQSPIITRSGRKQTSRPRALIIQTDDKDSLNKLINNALSENQSSQQSLGEGNQGGGKRNNGDGSCVDPLGAIPVSQDKKEEVKDENEGKKSEEKIKVAQSTHIITESQTKESTLSIECDSIPVFVSKNPKKSKSRPTSLGQSETLPEIKPDPSEINITPKISLTLATTSSTAQILEPETAVEPEIKSPSTQPPQITVEAKSELSPQIKITESPLPQTKEEKTCQENQNEDSIPQITIEPKPETKPVLTVPETYTKPETKEETKPALTTPETNVKAEPKEEPKTVQMVAKSETKEETKPVLTTSETNVKTEPKEDSIPQITVEPRPETKPVLTTSETNVKAEPKEEPKTVQMVAKSEQKPQIKATGTLKVETKTAPAPASAPTPATINAKSEPKTQIKLTTSGPSTKGIPMTTKRALPQMTKYKTANMTTKSGHLTPQSKTRSMPTTKSLLSAPQTKTGPITTKSSVPGKKVPYITTAKSTPSTVGPKPKTTTGTMLGGKTTPKMQGKVSTKTAYSKVQTKASSTNPPRSVSATAKMFGTVQTKKTQTERERHPVQHSSATMQTLRQINEINKQCTREDQAFNRRVELYEEFSKIRASYTESTK